MHCSRSNSKNLMLWHKTARHFSYLAHILFVLPSWSINCFIVDVRRQNPTVEMKDFATLFIKFQGVLTHKTKPQSRNLPNCMKTAHLDSSLHCSLVRQKFKELYDLFISRHVSCVSYMRYKKAVICAVSDSLWAFSCLFPCIIQSFPEVTAAIYMQTRRPLTRHTNVM